MKLVDLKDVAYSTRDNILFCIIYDAKVPYDLYESNCSIEYAIDQYGEKEVKRIDVENDFLILELEM